MKKFLITLSIVALSMPAFAAEAKKEKKPAEKPAAEKPAETKPEAKPGDAKADKATRPMPMNARADSIDASAKTFSMKRKDGVEVKHVVTDKTEIKQGEAVAKFGDIKVGDMVSGLRNKKSETEYEVVKITKFGPAAKKEPKAEEKKP